MPLGLEARGLLGAAGGAVATGTWIALDSTTLTSTAFSVTFTSAGSAEAWSGFTDLVLVSYVRTEDPGTSITIKLYLNSDTTAANYPIQTLTGDGSSAFAASFSNYIPCMFGTPAGGSGSNIFGVSVVAFQDINAANYTTAITRSATDQDGSGRSEIVSATWEDTSAVTSMIMQPSAGSFDMSVGTRFDLFGVKAAA